LGSRAEARDPGAELLGAFGELEGGLVQLYLLVGGQTIDDPDGGPDGTFPIDGERLAVVVEAEHPGGRGITHVHPGGFPLVDVIERAALIVGDVNPLLGPAQLVAAGDWGALAGAPLHHADALQVELGCGERAVGTDGFRVDQGLSLLAPVEGRYLLAVDQPVEAGLDSLLFGLRRLATLAGGIGRTGTGGGDQADGQDRHDGVGELLLHHLHSFASNATTISSR